MRQGNFSELLTPKPLLRQGVRYPGSNDGACLIPNNVIPQTQLSKNGLGLLNMFPATERDRPTQLPGILALAPRISERIPGSVDYTCQSTTITFVFAC